MNIVSPCLVRDLPTYRIAFQGLLEHLPAARPHVVTRREDFRQFHDACGSGLILLDERQLVEGMDLETLRALPQPYFPAGAGWYFQQFLKWAFVLQCGRGESCLVWDADTVPLRPIEFTDAAGRTLLTSSDEHHRPYFDTFEALLGFRPDPRPSFISQHQWIEVDLLRELVERIERRSDRPWPWAVMEGLRGEGSNRFSEYETYANFGLETHPSRFVIRELPWTRHARSMAGFPPTARGLELLAERFAFASFESNRSLRGWCVHWLRTLLRWY